MMNKYTHHLGNGLSIPRRSPSQTWPAFKGPLDGETFVVPEIHNRIRQAMMLAMVVYGHIHCPEVINKIAHDISLGVAVLIIFEGQLRCLVKVGLVSLGPSPGNDAHKDQKTDHCDCTAHVIDVRHASSYKLNLLDCCAEHLQVSNHCIQLGFAFQFHQKIWQFHRPE